MLKVICSDSNVEICALDRPDLDFAVFLGPESEPSLKDFLSILNSPLRAVPEGYDQMASVLNVSGAAKMLIVPRHIMDAHKKNVGLTVTDLLASHGNSEYLRSYAKCRSFLSSLQPSLVDASALQNLIKKQKHDGVKTNLSSFMPMNGRTNTIKYSMASSSTGRLSVTSGPKVLTSPSEVKSVLRSRFQDGSILQLDLCSAEPNFALFVSGKSPKADVYADMCSSVLSNAVDRGVAKLVTLSALYGQSTRNLEKQLPAGIGAAGVIRSIRRYLSYRSLLEKLQEKMQEANLRNYLGRPLPVDKQRLLVSHYLQSSVAEASMVMFSDFCLNEPTAVPLFVIHDALIVDCEKELADRLLNEKILFLDFDNAKFPVKVRALRNNYNS